MNRQQFAIVCLVLDIVALCSVFFFAVALLPLYGQSISPIYFYALSFVLLSIAVFWRVVPRYCKSKSCFGQGESRKIILEEKAITALTTVMLGLIALPLKTTGCLYDSFFFPVPFLFWGTCLLTSPFLFAWLIKRGEIGGECAEGAYQLFVGLTLISIVANTHHLLVALDSVYLDLSPLGYTLKPLLQTLLSFGFIVKCINAFLVAFVFLSWLYAITARYASRRVLEKERVDVERTAYLAGIKVGLTGKIAIALGVLTLLLVPPGSLYCEPKPVTNGVTFPLFVPGISGAYFLAGVALIIYQLLVPPSARKYIRVGLHI